MAHSRTFAVVVALLLLSGALHIWSLDTLPPGFNNDELQTLAVTGRVQHGQLQVFVQSGAQAQETFFHIIQAITAGFTGSGLITLRMPALWAGLLTASATYALARRLYGSRLALLATALLVTGFWPVLLTRLSLREAFVPLFTVFILLAFCKTFHVAWRITPDAPSTVLYSLLGLTTAASLYVHWYGLFLCAIITGAVIYLFVTRQPISRRAARASGFAILISIIAIIPYAITTALQPDASGLASMRAAMSPPNALQSALSGILAIFPDGDLSAVYNVPGRPLLGPISAILLAAGWISGLLSWRRPARFIPAMAALIGLLPLLLSTESGSFLAAVGVLPLLYILAGSGAGQVMDFLTAHRPGWRRAAPWLMAALVVANLVWTGYDLFQVWPAQEETRIAYRATRGLLAHYLDQTAGGLPSVVCSPHLTDTEGDPGDITLLELMMQHENAPIRFVDCANGIVIASGGEQQQFAFTDRSIYERMVPAMQRWLTGHPEIAVPGLEPGSVLDIQVDTELQDAVGRLLTTAPAGYAPESPGGTGPVRLPVRFGGNITFLGYEPPESTTFAPGGVIPLITDWRVDGAVPRDLRIFAHVLSDPAAIVAQSSAMNSWPPSLRSRDIFMQANYITLPDSIPPGTYDLSIGAYRANSGERLPVFDGEEERGNRLFLYQITVKPEED